MYVSMSAFILDKSLAMAKKRHTPVVLYLTDDTQLNCKITNYDDSAIFVDNDGKEKIICRNDVFTIAPAYQVQDDSKRTAWR